MNFVAIETSCDETSIALFSDNHLKYHTVYSQIPFHTRYGGVVPEIASRKHSEEISKIISDAKVKDISAVGFTRGPGLKGSLLIGKIAAHTISNYFNAKLIGINHLEGHLLSTEIDNDKIVKKLRFPLISLIASGGHSELWYVSGYGRYKLIGETRDDACGEAFDKVAKVMKLGYPGGPIIDKLSRQSVKTELKFTVPDVMDSYDYSFSGIKTQVAYYVRNLKKINKKKKIEIASAFEEAICLSLIKKLELAAIKYKVNDVVVCGGVSANSRLRELLLDKFNKIGIRVSLPDKRYTSDNAAMIGACMLRRFELGKFKNSVKLDPDLKIGSWI